VRWLALALAAFALAGCETTAEKSAKLELAAKQHERSGPTRRKLSITRLSTKVRTGATVVLHTSEGAAVVVTLHNNSSSTMRDVPLEITVKDAHGASVYTNTAPGLGAELASAPLIPAHGTFSWIDDQVQASGVPASVSAKIGEGAPVTGTIPQLSVEGAHLIEDPTSGPGAEGSIVNHSAVDQQELVVYALARRGSTIVAAGRAVLPSAPANATTRFQLFFIGDPRGSRLEVSVPATTLG
jgi:hypothetical protein